MTPPEMYVGIDVAKDQLQVALRPGGEAWSVTNDRPGLRELVKRLAASKPALVVLEATAGMEMPVAAVLAAAALPVVAINPAMPGSSPGPPADWPRRTSSMLMSWPSSARL